MICKEYQLYNYDNSGNPVYLAKLAGDSNESKPTSGIVDGSTWEETDTGKSYIYDEIAGWAEKVVATAEVQAASDP